MSTPLATLLNDLKTKITSVVSDITIYDHWIPTAGAKVPCVSMFVISGPQEEVGIGQQVSANQTGVNMVYHVQLDVWAFTSVKVVEFADQIKKALFDKRGEFGTLIKDIEKETERGPITETPEHTKELLYRVILQYRTVYAITKS